MTEHHDEMLPIAIPMESLREKAAAVAQEMKSGVVTPALRKRFIDVRSVLFQRGIYDPVLVRFDSATAPRATPEEIATQLESVAQSLT